MGYFTLKIAVVVALMLVALVAFPLGAIAAHKRARAKAGGAAACALTPTAAAGVLLHREKLGGEIAVDRCLDPTASGYDAHRLRLRVDDTGRRPATVAELAEAAFAVARATLHADGDPDFLANEARGTPIAILANAAPVAAFLGLALPEARGLLIIVTPVMVCCLAGYAVFSLPAERKAADRALALLRRHGLISPEETPAAAACLRARAALALARPWRACFRVSPLL